MLVSGDEILVNVRGASHDVSVRLSRGSVTMDATYMTMFSQKQLTINNRSDVIVRFHWSCFATQQLEVQFKQRWDEDLYY